MKTLDKYVAKEMIVPFVAGFAVVLILLVGTVIFNAIPQIKDKLEYWPTLLYSILLQCTNTVFLALPSGALLGCSLAISRLTHDSEITMMRMAGIRTTRIFLPVFVVGAIASGTAYLFQEKVIVWAQSEIIRVQRKLMLAPGPPPIQANQFFHYENYFFYVNAIERVGGQTRLRDVMIYEPPIGRGFASLTTARTVTESNHVWHLHDGITYRVDKDGEPELIGHFKRMKLDIRRAIADFIDQQQKTPDAMTIPELRGQMRLLAESKLPARAYQIVYNYRLALPLSSFILILCVAPLSLRFGRSGGFMGVLLGIVILFFYWNVIVFSRLLSETGALAPVLAGWSEIIIFGILGALLMWKVE